MGEIKDIPIKVNKPYSLYNLDNYIVEINGFGPILILGLDSVRTYLENASMMMRRIDAINRFSLSFSAPMTRDSIPQRQMDSLEKVVEEINKKELEGSKPAYEIDDS
jgi:hypothetical protein